MLDKIASFFVSDAFAMAPPQGDQGGGNALMGFLPLIIIFVIFYFLLIRPQQKKQKEHASMLNSLKKGDKVITSGGIYGLIEQVNTDTIIVKVGDNVKIEIGKAFVSALRQ